MNQIHSSWDEFLTEDVRNQLDTIMNQIGEDFTPKKEWILRFMNEDLNEKKVIWVGQDPYFQPGVANGRSFQPNDLEDWSQPFRQVSLKNIIRLIHVSYQEEQSYSNIKGYKEIVKEIRDGQFLIKQPKEWFDSLEQQGVLFLNTSLTCQVGNPNSHKKIWDSFSKQLIQFISVKRPDMVWFLWGRESIALNEYIKNGVRYESRHPMMCSPKYEDDFLKSDCFLKTKELIDWLG